MGSPRKAIECGKALLEHGKRYANSRSNVMGYYSMSMGYGLAGDFEACIDSSRRAMAVSKDPFYSKFPGISMNLAYALSGRFKEVLESQRELVLFCEKNEVGELLVHENIIGGAAMVATGRMDEGMQIIEEVRNSAHENHRKTAIIVSEYVLGLIYLQIATGPKPKLSTMAKNVGFLMKNVPFASKRAEAHYHKAIELAEEIGAHGFIGISCLDLGLLYQAGKKTDKAKQFFTRAVAVLERCKAEPYLQKAMEAMERLS
jgi:tetratricopeptide (TPR) repeat protein